MNSSVNFWAVVPAAGIGTRFDNKTPKQFHKINGQYIAEVTLNKLLDFEWIKEIIIPCDMDCDSWQNIKTKDESRLKFVCGGDQRAQSVFNGLRALNGHANDSDWILVHDIVRPCVDTKDIEKLCIALKNSRSGAILATRVTETLKLGSKSNEVIETANRDNFWLAQTPQIFRYKLLKQALSYAFKNSVYPTDESHAVEYFGERVTIVEGRSKNPKITEIEDLKIAESILNAEED